MPESVGISTAKAAPFLNPPRADAPFAGVALNMDAVIVNGHVLLRKGFHAEGAVLLPSGEIRGDVDCSGGAFQNPRQTNIPASGTALVLNNTVVKGAVLLCDGFRGDGNVHIIGAFVGSDLVCNAAEFRGEFVSQRTIVKGALFWEEISNPGGTILNLKNTTVDALVDDEKSWPDHGMLKLDGFAFQRFSGRSPKQAETRLLWLGRQDSFAPQPYRQVAAVLRAEGDNAGARRVLFEMARLRLGHESVGRGWFCRFRMAAWSQVFRITVGYGFYPGRALLCLLALTLLWTLLFAAAYTAGSIAPTDKDAYYLFKTSSQLPAHYAAFNPFVYSLENSFPLVKFGQVDRWQVDPDRDWQYHAGSWVPRRLSRFVAPKALRCLAYLQIILGWILATMGIAAVTGVVQKD